MIIFRVFFYATGIGIMDGYDIDLSLISELQEYFR